MNEHGISWSKSDSETDGPWNIVILFKASASDLSRLSIQFLCNHNPIYPKMSDWVKRSRRHNAWVLDSVSRHCGTLHGLRSGWTNFHNSLSCELVLQSSFAQKEVKPEDVDEHRVCLPLEYSSSDDYYNDIFDTSHYKYTECWAQKTL